MSDPADTLAAPTAARHVTLVRPGSVSQLLKLDTDVSATGAPPIGLAYLAATLKQAGYGITAIDALGEAIDKHTPVDGMPLCINGLLPDEIVARIPRDTACIGVTCMFACDWLHCRDAVNHICAAFPDTPVVMGGEQSTGDAEYIMRRCPGLTAVVCGEAEEVFVNFLEALHTGTSLATVPGLVYRGAHGEILRTEAAKRKRHLDEIPWPLWEAFPLEPYLARGGGYGKTKGRIIPMIASRGCPYRCTFCSNPGMWGKLWNVRSADDVIAEMKHYKETYNIDGVDFYDLTTIIRRDWIVEFTKKLIDADLKIEWSMPSGTRSESLDGEVAALIKKAGCGKISFAPESGSPRVIQLIQKRVDIEDMLRRMRESSREGLVTKAHIIMGFPSETPRDVLHTYSYLVRMAWAGVNDCPIYIFHPYPGSVLHAELRAAAKLPADDDEYDRFMALSLYSNYSNISSWSDHIRPGQLRLFAVCGMCLFYGSQFLFRPWRILDTVYRLIRSRPETMLERFGDVTLRRWFRMVRGEYMVDAASTQTDIAR